MNNYHGPSGPSPKDSRTSGDSPNDTNARTQANGVFSTEEEFDAESSFFSAEQVFKLIDKTCILFHDSAENAYLSVPLSNGASTTFTVGSKGFTTWINGTCYNWRKRILSKDEMNSLVSLCTGAACYGGPEHEVAVGVAWHEGVVYFDHHRDDGKITRIDGNGYTTVTDSPVHFLQTRGMKEIPLPVRGGSLEEIQEFVNVSGRDLPLVAGFILSQFQPRGTRPLLFVYGPSGSGKSMASGLFKSITDPHEVALQAPPKKEKDILIAAQTSSILVYDNLSGRLKPSMSDAFCRLASGSGIRERELYSNFGDAFITGQAGVIISSVEDVISRGDLVQRTLKVTLEKLTKEDRLGEGDIYERFNNAHARVLGAIFEAVSAGIRNIGEVRKDRTWARPRLADTAEWTVACEETLPFEGGSFLAALERRQEELKADMLEANPVFDSLARLSESMGIGEIWSGSASDLSETLNDLTPGGPKLKPHSLSSDLNLHGHFYASKVGLQMKKDPNDRMPKTRQRLIHFTKVEETE